MTSLGVALPHDAPNAVAERFRRFVGESRALLQPVPLDTKPFLAFIEASKALLFRDAEAFLPDLTIALRPILPLLGAAATVDLLDIAYVTHAEDRYTELLRWALWPGDDDLGTRCQQAWLAHLGIPAPAHGVPPTTQLRTADGRPDLVLHYPERTVVVEAKTRSPEHLTPGGTHQTRAYVPATRTVFGLPPDHPIHVVYLTLDRSAAANVEARRVSYLETALVLAQALADLEMPQPIRGAYDALLGHLALRAVPSDIAMREVALAVQAFDRTCEAPSPRAFIVIARLRQILADEVTE